MNPIIDKILNEMRSKMSFMADYNGGSKEIIVEEARYGNISYMIPYVMEDVDSLKSLLKKYVNDLEANLEINIFNIEKTGYAFEIIKHSDEFLKKRKQEEEKKRIRELEFNAESFASDVLNPVYPARAPTGIKEPNINIEGNTAYFNLSDSISVEYFIEGNIVKVKVFENGKPLMDIDSSKSERGAFPKFKEKLRSRIHSVDQVISYLIDAGYSDQAVANYIHRYRNI